MEPGFAKRCLVMAMIGFSLLANPTLAGTWRVKKSFPAPSRQTAGLTWDGQFLWNASYFSNVYYKIDPNSGTVVSTIPANSTYKEDLAWANGYLWNAYADGSIVKIDPATGDCVDNIPVDLTKYPKYGRLQGLEWDGQYLWTNYAGWYIIQIDPVTKQVFHSFERSFGAPDDYMDGLTFAWGHLFMDANETATIFEVDPCTGALLDYFTSPSGINIGPEGLAFDGEYLWYADNTTNRIYQLELLDDYSTKPRAIGKTRIACESEVDGTRTLTASPKVSLLQNPLTSLDRLGIVYDAALLAPAASFSVQILDAQGRLVHQEKSTIQGNRHFLAWPACASGRVSPGVYLLRLNIGQQAIFAKTVIAR